MREVEFEEMMQLKTANKDFTLDGKPCKKVVDRTSEEESKVEVPMQESNG
jgi:hypothetical protein